MRLTRRHRVGLQRQATSTAIDPSSISSCRVQFHHGTTAVVDQPQADACLEQARAYIGAGGQRTLTVHGYASMEGDAAFNVDLAQRRAVRIKQLLVQRGVPEASVVVAGHGPDSTYPGQPANRRVEVVLAEAFNFDPEDVQVPRFKCGPDVTAKIVEALDGVRNMFHRTWGSDDDKRDEACEELRSVEHGGDAWDIVELHNNGWILNYRPLCATQGATPACGSSVQVGSDCYYAGSANYVVFGAMCKLCYDHFLAHGRAGSMPGYTGYMDFDERSMVDLIDLYKSDSANAEPSRGWARAGYRGWPTAPAPHGDRQNCAPQCSQPYNGPSFHVHWYPYQTLESVRGG